MLKNLNHFKRTSLLTEIQHQLHASNFAAPALQHIQCTLTDQPTPGPPQRPQHPIDTMTSPPSPSPLAHLQPTQQPGFSRTFYKRKLPCPPAIEFSSQQGKQLFAQALADNTMNNFFKLIEQFRTQDEPAYCGLASISMVLNSLAIDPRRPWRGPWRWFHEGQLDCCHPLEKVREEGVTLEQAACLARCNGAKVELMPFGTFTLEEFREMVRDVCSSEENTQQIVVSYSRKELLQTGDGHFSPIGGYSALYDMVLILDTARFKYPPHWVPVELLYKAMARVDSVTGLPRGLIRLGSHSTLHSVLFTLDVRDIGWKKAYQYVDGDGLGESVRQYLLSSGGATGGDTTGTATNKEEQQTTTTAQKTPTTTTTDNASVSPQLHRLLQTILSQAPVTELSTFFAVRTVGHGCEEGTCTQVAMIDTFLQELHATHLYSVVADVVKNFKQLPSTQQQTGSIAAEKTTNSTITASTETKPTTSCCDGAHTEHTEKHTQATTTPNSGNNTKTNSKTTTSKCSGHDVNPATQAALQDHSKRDYTIERLCMMLLVGERQEGWWHAVRDLPAELQRELELLLNITDKEVLDIEVSFLQSQFTELPAIQNAVDQAEAAQISCQLE